MGESNFLATIKIQVRCLLKSIQDAQQPQSISSSPFTHWFREAIHPLQQQQAQQQQQLEHHYRQQHFEQTQKDQTQFTDLTSTTASSATASLYSNNQAAFIDVRSTNIICVCSRMQTNNVYLYINNLLFFEFLFSNNLYK